MKAITGGSSAEVQAILRTLPSDLNFTDENGMTPLANACYKGREDVAGVLIDRGADVNDSKHVHGYTALMFAALGGHVRVLTLLLEHGADATATNSVNRTAAQMAAFVGQHRAATVINNFVAREQLEGFTKPRGLDSEPKLAPQLLDPLLRLVRALNVNPVRVAMALTNDHLLLEHHKKVVDVLEMLCQAQMEQEDPNEGLALKFHHLAFLLKHVAKLHGSKQADQESQLQSLCRFWLKGDANGFPVILENLLRQSIKEFPYHDSSIFIQLLRTLSSVPVGSEPSAITILAKSINGQKGFDEDSPVCSTCGECAPPKKCSRCKSVQYCDQNCQKLHWFTHKKVCDQLKKEREVELSDETNG